MSDDIRPALSPEEWKQRWIWLDAIYGATAALTPDGMVSIEDDDYYTGFTRYTSRRHALAALALYGQPFGFTQEDVELLNGVEDYNAGARDAVKRLEALARRIAALLPPK